MKEGFYPGRFGIMTFQNTWPKESGILESLEEITEAKP